MALNSMTGFGRGEAAADGIKAEAELSSVNRRQFDVRANLPKSMAVFEAHIYKAIHSAVSRGCVTGTFKINYSGEARSRSARIDKETARSYITGLRRVAKELGLRDDLGAGDLLSLPEVVIHEAVPADSKRLWSLVRRALNDAIKQLLEMRAAEGAVLEKDLRRRFTRLQRGLAKIVRHAPRTVRRHRAALVQRLRDADLEVGHTDPHLAREIALFADRCDISEEIVRLESHFKQAGTLMGNGGTVGRTLDFLCQEMFREINTIGSKANDPEISRCVISFKAELEAIREQVQNVE